MGRRNGLTDTLRTAGHDILSNNGSNFSGTFTKQASAGWIQVAAANVLSDNADYFVNAQGPWYEGINGMSGLSDTIGALNGNGMVANYGTLYTGSLTLQPGSFFDVEISPSAWDMLDVIGTVDVTGAQLNLVPLASFSSFSGSQFLIVQNESIYATVGAFEGLPEGASLEVAGSQFFISYTGGTGNDIVLTSVPEPATMALLGLAISGLGGYIRRRR